MTKATEGIPAGGAKGAWSFKRTIDLSQAGAETEAFDVQQADRISIQIETTGTGAGGGTGGGPPTVLELHESLDGLTFFPSPQVIVLDGITKAIDVEAVSHVLFKVKTPDQFGGNVTLIGYLYRKSF